MNASNASRVSGAPTADDDHRTRRSRVDRRRARGECATPMPKKREETVPLLAKEVDGVQDALERGHETTPNAWRGGIAAFVTAVMWFWMNIANNIALQNFRDDMGYDATRGDGISARLRTMTFVTTTQMLIGTAAVLGVKALSRKGESLGEMWRGTTMLKLALGALHSGGSLFTNSGFMFASASFVQVVKLVEPFEMLMFDASLKNMLGRPTVINVGVLLSVSMVVASAILLALQGTVDAKRVDAVVFAFLSGLCITCRIVLQKTFRLANETKMTDIGCVIDEYLSMTFCALLTLLGLFTCQLAAASSDRLDDLFVALEYFRVELILFHPLYNFFSLMTLTFVASITHSLLNVSKRVIGLLTTLVWFHEPVTHRIMIGIVGAFVGGVWYTFEKRYAALETSRSFWTIELLRWRRPSGGRGRGIS